MTHRTEHYVPGLARAVLDHIEAHPETHDQAQWHCGTTHCIAGWACVLMEDVGARLESHERCFGGSGTEVAAQMLLGLDDGHAVRMFYQSDNASALELLREYVASEEQAK